MYLSFTIMSQEWAHKVTKELPKSNPSCEPKGTKKV